MLGNLLEQARSKLSEMKNDLLKYKSKEFLEATMGASALVIMADGTIDKNEKAKMMAFVQNDDNLSIYETSEVVRVYKDFIDTFEMDADIGEAKAMKSIGKMKGKPDQSRLIIRMAIAIGGSDGDFDADEKAAVARICGELGVPASEFGL